MPEYKLKFVKNRIDIHPTPYIVMSYFDFFDSKPALVESYCTREDAMYVGQYRQDQGYIVNVYKELAHSRNIGN